MRYISLDTLIIMGKTYLGYKYDKYIAWIDGLNDASKKVMLTVCKRAQGDKYIVIYETAINVEDKQNLKWKFANIHPDIGDIAIIFTEKAWNNIQNGGRRAKIESYSDDNYGIILNVKRAEVEYIRGLVESDTHFIWHSLGKMNSDGKYENKRICWHSKENNYTTRKKIKLENVVHRITAFTCSENIEVDYFDTIDEIFRTIRIDRNSGCVEYYD